MKLIRLGSDRWHPRVERDAGGAEYLYLSNAEHPADSMRKRLPPSWQQLDEGRVEQLAREPELRLWTDEYGIRWRVSPVGPGTPYDVALHERYLVFDSTEMWAGITPFPAGNLGELTDDDLKALRNSVSDFGGSRRSFRPPRRELRQA